VPYQIVSRCNLKQLDTVHVVNPVDVNVEVADDYEWHRIRCKTFVHLTEVIEQRRRDAL
jgi:hypothetical protein